MHTNPNLFFNNSNPDQSEIDAIIRAEIEKVVNALKNEILAEAMTKVLEIESKYKALFTASFTDISLDTLAGIVALNNSISQTQKMRIIDILKGSRRDESYFR